MEEVVEEEMEEVMEEVVEEDMEGGTDGERIEDGQRNERESGHGQGKKTSSVCTDWTFIKAAP